MTEEPTPGPGDITMMLANWAAGRPEAGLELWPAVYHELRMIAHAYMRRERVNHTLQTTALVNEAFLRLFHDQPVNWDNRKHFFCSIAQVMRHILVDYAREQGARKRGGECEKLPISAAFGVPAQEEEFIALDAALERLQRLNPRQAQVVQMRFLIGLTGEETAAILGVSPETVKLDWRFAKAWLQRQMRAGG